MSNFFKSLWQNISRVGLPDGVVNIIHGYGEITGRKLVQNKECDYCGGEVASEILKKLQIELFHVILS